MNKIRSHLAVLHTDVILTDTLLLIFCHLRTVFPSTFQRVLVYKLSPPFPNRRQHGPTDMKVTAAFHNFGKASTNVYTNNQRITTFVNGSVVTWTSKKYTKNTSKNKQKSSVTIDDERFRAVWLRERKCESGKHMCKGTNHNGQVGKN